MSLVIVNRTASELEVPALGQFVAAGNGTEQDISYITKNQLVAAEALDEIETLVNNDEAFLRVPPAATLSKADSLTLITNIRNGSDPSLTPVTPHASQHENGGADEIDVTGLSGLLADNQKADLTSPEVTGILPISKGGTGSATQNFVDLSTTQSIGGTKTFTGNVKSSPAPVAGEDLTNKTYVDAQISSVVSGISWQEPVLDKDLATPPGAPTTGDRYIVATGATGAWAGQDGNIAEWDGATWQFTTVDEGFAIYIEDEDKQYVYNGTSWVTTGSTQNHNNLSGIQGGAPGDYQHVTSAEKANIPTSDEKAALVGTDGTPSGANPYVTDSDARLTDARTPTAHASTHSQGGSDPINLEDLATTSTNTSEYFRPDGAGGVETATLPAGTNNVNVGTTAPGTTDGTILWLNTAAGYNSTLMYRDQRVNKWLSVETLDLAFGADSVKNKYLSLPGISTPGNRTAYRTRLNGTIIGVVARARDGAGANFEIQLNGSPIVGGDFLLDGSGNYTDNARNHDFTAGDDITIFCDNTDRAKDVEVLLVMKWRA